MSEAAGSLAGVGAWIGLDWGDGEHAVCLQAAGGGSERSKIRQRPEALQDWVRQLRERFEGKTVCIAVEQSRGALLYALMSFDFIRLYPVNPQTLAKYRKAFFPAGGKDDPSDAELLLELVRDRRERLREWSPGDVGTRSLQLLTEGRRKLVNRRTALSNHLTSTLKSSFPQALEWLNPVHRSESCRFLKRWPTLQKLRKAKLKQLESFLQRYDARRAEQSGELHERIRSATPLTEDAAVLLSSGMTVQALANQIIALNEAVGRFDKQIARLFESHPDRRIFESLPGAGAALAPRLLAAVGADRSRFRSAREIQQLSGIAPVTVRSGRTCWVHWRLACPKFVRQSFHEFAGCSIAFSGWARAFYQQQRGRGNSHSAAVRTLAYKWIRILFRCWKDGSLYDETRYHEALRRRNSPLASLLEQERKPAKSVL